MNDKKVDIESEKVDIESVLLEKGKDFVIKTAAHIRRMFEKFGYDEVFGRSAVTELLGLKNSSASKLLSNLVQADIIEPVSGYGKGKYKFKSWWGYATKQRLKSRRDVLSATKGKGGTWIRVIWVRFAKSNQGNGG